MAVLDVSISSIKGKLKFWGASISASVMALFKLSKAS